MSHIIKFFIKNESEIEKMRSRDWRISEEILKSKIFYLQLRKFRKNLESNFTF